MKEEGCYPTTEQLRKNLEIMEGIASALEGIECRACFTMKVEELNIDLYILPTGEPFTREERGKLVRDVGNALEIQGGVWRHDFQQYAGYHRLYRGIARYKKGVGLSIEIGRIAMPSCRIEKKERTEIIYESVCD